MNATTTCDPNRPTAGFDEFEFRASQLIVGCRCMRNDGMQHECRRANCMGRPSCLEYPEPGCRPSKPCPPLAKSARVKSADSADAGTKTVAVTSLPKHPAVIQWLRPRQAFGRHLRRWATDQYDDQPAFKKLFEPCPYHATKAKKL